MKFNKFSVFVTIIMGTLFSFAAEVPPYPGIEGWKFREELAAPENLAPVSYKNVEFKRDKVAGYESYRIDVNGDKVVITTEDDEGLRRAKYYYEDRVRAGDLKSITRKPWVKNRISRCFFGPIKRPPLNHDELMDDIDYYPRAYLNRLAHEGVNGLWLTVEWRDIAETSFTHRSPDADKRLAKLRKTVDRCLEYGIKTWIFCIEPKAVDKSDIFYKEHPELFGDAFSWGNRVIMCTARPETQRYIEESVKDIFTRVPRLGGIMMIAHGERPTTCLSPVDPVAGVRSNCSHCRNLEPWQIYRNTTDAIMRGIRAAGSDAEYISWFYQPQVRPDRAPWVAEVARHVPEGVSFVYNFESGAMKDQLGRYRPGGDYWLSYAGPAEGFRAVAAASAEANTTIGAKIQVCNSHEVATVPFVPAPGLLYRKYKAMKAARVSTVLQCWYFGNYPGFMNRAAGELAFEDFESDETDFLRRLAASEWGEDSKKVAEVWERFSDAYMNYPLSNDMQYYGPFHAGVAWPLYPYVEMKRLGRTWKPHDPPSGDTIGESLENHTLDEAAILAGRMARGVEVKNAQGENVLDELARKWKGNRERMLDIGVMKALAAQFKSANNIFAFYRERAIAISASRLNGDNKRAREALARMDELVKKEEEITASLIPYAEEDSRLGFHSEAEAHQYHPAKLRWRLGELKETHRQIAEIDAALKRGEKYPESKHEKDAPKLVVGGEAIVTSNGVKISAATAETGDLSFKVIFPKGVGSVIIRTTDAAATSFYKCVAIDPSGSVTATATTPNSVNILHEVIAVSKSVNPDGSRVVEFTLSSIVWGDKSLRPAWIQVGVGATPVWPSFPSNPDHRLNLSTFPEEYGRVIWAD